MNFYEKTLFHATGKDIKKLSDFSEGEIYPLRLGHGINFFDNDRFAVLWKKIKKLKKVIPARIKVPESSILNLDDENVRQRLREVMEKYKEIKGSSIKCEVSELASSCVEYLALENHADVVLCDINSFEAIVGVKPSFNSFEAINDSQLLRKQKMTKQVCVRDRAFLKII